MATGFVEHEATEYTVNLIHSLLIRLTKELGYAPSDALLVAALQTTTAYVATENERLRKEKEDKEYARIAYSL